MKRFYLVMCALLLIAPAVALADEPPTTGKENKWEELTNTTHEALQLVRQEQYDTAKQYLGQFSEEFLKSNQEELNLSMTQLRVLTTSYDNALRALTSTSAGHEHRYNSVMQFYLVVDALRTEENPLWMDAEKQLMEPFLKMKSAAKQKNEQSFQYYLNEFFNKYEMIHPALNVDLNEYIMTRIDSRVTFLMENRTHFFSDPQYVKQLDDVEKDFRGLFDGTLKNSADPSLIWIISSIGGIITVTLVYVAWKKYRAEKKIAKVRRHSKY
jgi:sporulation protein YpjB